MADDRRQDLTSPSATCPKARRRSTPAGPKTAFSLAIRRSVQQSAIIKPAAVTMPISRRQSPASSSDPHVPSDRASSVGCRADRSLTGRGRCKGYIAGAGDDDHHVIASSALVRVDQTIVKRLLHRHIESVPALASFAMVTTITFPIRSAPLSDPSRSLSFRFPWSRRRDHSAYSRTASTVTSRSRPTSITGLHSIAVHVGCAASLRQPIG